MVDDFSINQPRVTEAGSSSGSHRAATMADLNSHAERLDRVEVTLAQIQETLKHLSTRARTPNPSPPRGTPPPYHRRTPPNSPPRSPPTSPEVNRVLDFNTDYNLRHDHRQRREHYEGRRQHREEDLLRNIKVNIPEFHGNYDPNCYLEWELRMEGLFQVHGHVPEDMKVKLAVVEFRAHAARWWSTLCRDRVQAGERPVNTWHTLKEVMRQRYVPRSHYRDLFQTINSLKQGSQTIREYYLTLEDLLRQSGIREHAENTMARFLGGLNPDIARPLRLCKYEDLSELVELAVSVEKDLHYYSSHKTVNSSTNNWHKNVGEHNGPVNEGSHPHAKPVVPPVTSYRNPPPAPVRRQPVVCFKCQGKGHISSQCPNNRAYVMREEPEDDIEDIPGNWTELDWDSKPEEPDEGTNDAQARTLVIQEVAPLKPAQGMVSEQRDNIFQTIAQVKGKSCLMIIDGGSSANCCSKELVQELQLTTTPHPKPYHLQWMNESGTVKVTRQVFVRMKIGKFKERVLCDVVPMTAGHILLGRPWAYDRDATHFGRSNVYQVKKHGRTFRLQPMQKDEVIKVQTVLQREHKKKIGHKGKKAAPKLPGHGRVMTMFQVIGSSTPKFQSLDSRTNPFKGRGNDANPYSKAVT